jgi:hypothetical protein
MVQEACFPGIIAIRKDIQSIGIAMEGIGMEIGMLRLIKSSYK